MNFIKLKKPGNYPIASILPRKDGPDFIWEDKECQSGEVFEEWQIDTSFLNSDDFEEVRG